MNSTEIYNNHLYGVIIISIWTLTITLTAFIYYLVYAIRSKLPKLELAIVYSLNTLTLLYKIARILKFLFQFIIDYVFAASCSDFIFLSISSIMDSTHSIILVYYAVYHVTNLSRHPVVVKTYGLVRKMSSFIAVMSIAIFLNVSLCIASLLLIYLNDSQCINARLKTLWAFVFQVIVPRTLSVFIYFVSIVLYLVSGLRRRSKLNMNDSNSKSFKRDLSLMFKFMAYSILIEISNSPQLAYYIITVTSCLNCGGYLNSYVYLYSIGDFFSFIQPLFLIYAHNIVRKRFVEIFKEFYSKIKNLFC